MNRCRRFVVSGRVQGVFYRASTEAAARRLVAMMPRLRAEGLKVKAVRIDSGDLADHARKVPVMDAPTCVYRVMLLVLMALRSFD